MNRRQQLATIFADTQDFIASTPALKQAANASAQATLLIDGEVTPELGEPTRAGEIVVTDRRSFQSARAIHEARPDARICVLNFASPTNPGGGVVTGSSAQEESLCRCSTLYATLNQKRLEREFYGHNRASRNPLATDDCIWSPSILVIKSDTELPERLPEEEWFSVDVLTCAAPNLHLLGRDIDELHLTELFTLHRRRARQIMRVAASRGADCLVTGAFGCGAFKNDPYLVASAWHEELRDLRGHFDLVEFAVFHMPYEQTNYDAFVDEFAEA